MDTQKLEDLKKIVHDLRDLKEKSGKVTKTADEEVKLDTAEQAETIARMQKQIETLTKSVFDGTRKGGFNFADRGSDIHGVAELTKLSQVGGRQRLLMMTRGAEQLPGVVQFQEDCDQLYIVSKILGCNPRSLNLWEQKMITNPLFAKAMDTATSTEGSEWIPTGFSSDLIRKVRLGLRVAALHPRINMPTNPYKLPAQGADAVAYLMPENTGDEDYWSAPTTGAGSGATTGRIPPSTPGTRQDTLTAKKLAARVLYSTEVDEDSIIPIVDHIRDEIAYALAYAQEDATVNGDTTATHMDSGVSGGKDRRRAWIGYRKLINNIGSGAQQDLSTFNLANIRTIRMKMGKYGVGVDNLAWISSVVGYSKIMNLDAVTTLDKYGVNATILQGELARLDGIPIIVSEVVPENLNNVGVQQGSTTDRSILLLVNRRHFLFGDRRQVTLKSAEKIESDQSVLVATERLDFIPTQVSTDKVASVGFNITTATIT